MADDEKKCKYCAMMIPKEAKICPHCRKKLTSSWGCMAAIIIFAFIMIWFAAMQTPSTPRTPPVNSDPSTATDAQIYREFEICMNLAKKTVDDDKQVGQAIAAKCMMRLAKYGDKRAQKAFATYFDLKQ